LAVNSSNKATHGMNRKAKTMSDPNAMIPTGQPQKIIELKLPLPYLLTIVGTIAMAVITMYFRGEKAAEEIVALRGDIRELRAELKVKDNATNTLAGSMALLSFRLETAESDIRTLKSIEKRGLK
jgi:hypothetical protein